MFGSWFRAPTDACPRITSLPSRIMDEISMFPHNVPLPDPKPAAWIIGGAMHVTNLFVRISQSRQVAEEEMPWADLYNESRGTSWFDWVSVSLLIYFQHGKSLTRFYSRLRLLRFCSSRLPSTMLFVSSRKIASTSSITRQLSSTHHVHVSLTHRSISLHQKYLPSPAVYSLGYGTNSTFPGASC